MAVANLHKPQKNHVDRIARFSLDAVKAAQATLVDESDPQRGGINLRVGFHSGSVVANVIGTKNPRCMLYSSCGRCLVFVMTSVSLTTVLLLVCLMIAAHVSVSHSPTRSFSFFNPSLARYEDCLFGDTVNTASRMESSSEANKVHMSGAAHDELVAIKSTLKCTSRGVVDIKGKGTC